MRELIVQSARLRLMRLALLTLGAAAITAGLSYLVGTLQRAQSEVMGHMEDRWRVSYDILVRPSGSAGTPGFFSSSQLSGGAGGISLQQWHEIKSLEDVDVAAPVARVGTVDFPVTVTVPGNEGLYRLDWEQRQGDGTRQYEVRGTSYSWVVSPSLLNPGSLEVSRSPWPTLVGDRRNPDAIPMELFASAGIDVAVLQDPAALDVRSHVTVDLVAVSPNEEARLMGLDKAVARGAYFGPQHSRALPESIGGSTTYNLPVLVSQGGVGDFRMRVKASRVDLPAQPTAAMLRDLAAGGGPAALRSRPATEVAVWESRSGYVADVLLNRLGTPQVTTPLSLRVQPPTDPAQFEVMASLDGARWPHAFQAVPTGVAPLPEGAEGSPVSVWRFSGLADPPKNPVSFHLVGTYDPELVKLPAASDPSGSLFRGGKATLLFDAAGKPLPSPVPLQPVAHPNGYLTAPPALITTVDAAEPFLSVLPITMVRVRVKGVEQISQGSIDKVEKVAKAIAAKTGLQADIMRGAAPEPLLVNLPGRGQVEAIGYAEQTWIKQGQAIHMFKELQRGDAMVLGMVLLVGVVFVIASSIVHVMLRQKELSTLAAVGWRLRDLLVLVWAESGLVAGVGGALACVILPRLQTLEAAGASILIYLVGSTLAMLVTGVANPMRLMRSSGVTPNKQLAHVENLWQMAWGSLRARRRNLLSLAAMVLPTALMVILTALTLRLEDRFFVTVLGSQVALEVGPFHYAMMVAAFLLAAATTADLMSLSVLERRNELSLLGAMGWRKASLRSIVLREGVLWGLTAGLTGGAVGLAALQFLYGRIQPALWPILPLILAIPMVTGLLAAAAPAESAARMQPNEGVKLS